MGKDDVATLERVASDAVQELQQVMGQVLRGTNGSQPAS